MLTSPKPMARKLPESDVTGSIGGARNILVVTLRQEHVFLEERKPANPFQYTRLSVVYTINLFTAVTDKLECLPVSASLPPKSNVCGQV